MSKYTGDLTDFGQTNSMFGKNIQAYYRAPKTEQDFGDSLENYTEMTGNELLALVPDNWFDDTNEEYWESEKKPFNGKDGQTNAYVKRGLDDNLTEYAEREQTNKYTWHFSTDENHIHFFGGGKIYAKGKEWFILKVINQDTTTTITNKYEAMDTSPYNERLQQLGLKTLVLI